LTPCCGLEVQNPTQALKSVKDPDSLGGDPINITFGEHENLMFLTNFGWKHMN